MTGHQIVLEGKVLVFLTPVLIQLCTRLEFLFASCVLHQKSDYQVQSGQDKQ